MPVGAFLITVFKLYCSFRTAVFRSRKFAYKYIFNLLKTMISSAVWAGWCLDSQKAAGYRWPRVVCASLADTAPKKK